MHSNNAYTSGKLKACMDTAVTPELYKHANSCCYNDFLPINVMTSRIAMGYIYRHVNSFTAPQRICKSAWLSWVVNGLDHPKTDWAATQLQMLPLNFYWKVVAFQHHWLANLTFFPSGPLELSGCVYESKKIGCTNTVIAVIHCSKSAEYLAVLNLLHAEQVNIGCRVSQSWSTPNTAHIWWPS